MGGEGGQKSTQHVTMTKLTLLYSAESLDHSRMVWRHCLCPLSCPIVGMSLVSVWNEVATWGQAPVSDLIPCQHGPNTMSTWFVVVFPCSHVV